MSDWVVEIDKNSVFTYSSPRVYDILGYKPEEVVGRRIRDITTEEETKRIAALLAQMVDKREPSLVFRHGALHKDGHWVYLEASVTPVYDENGVLLGYHAIDRDVTERVLAAAERRQLEERLEAQKRQFYRDSILSVTGGKLDICDPVDIEPYTSTALLTIDLLEARDVPTARHEVRRFCEEKGLSGERLDSLWMVSVRPSRMLSSTVSAGWSIAAPGMAACGWRFRIRVRGSSRWFFLGRLWGVVFLRRSRWGWVIRLFFRFRTTFCFARGRWVRRWLWC
jgi:PAS domain S-box-containing protein